MRHKQQFAEAGLAETRARLGIATQLDTLYESDRAAEQLRAVIQAKPAAPFGAVTIRLNDFRSNAISVPCPAR